MNEKHFLDRELVGVDFSSADLRGAHFERTLLVDADLSGADLRGARFVLCELRNVVLTGVMFDDTRFDGTMLVDIDGVDPAMRTLIEQGGGTFQHARASLR